MKARTRRSWLRRASVLAVLMTAPFDGLAVVPPMPTPQTTAKPAPLPFKNVPATDELYLRFREYRLALSDASTNVSPFFARHYLEWCLGSLLSKRSRLEVEVGSRAVRARLRTGAKVTIVHSIAVRNEQDGGQTLKLRISTGDVPRIYTYEVTYVREHSRLLISQLLVDTTKPHEPGDAAIIERFSMAPE